MAFRQFIAGVLAKSNLQPKDIDWVVDNHMKVYDRAFTSKTVDPEVNYEDLEQKGDAAVNDFLVWYFYNRFPQLDCPAGVPVVARLKIVYSSKATFFNIAKKLGFWQYIRASQSERDNREKSLLEDVFEAFVGATADIFNKKHELGFGNIVVSRILKTLFDDIDISLEYQDLYDAKTRLKEHFDTHKSLGQLVTDYDLATRVVTLSIAEPHKPVVVELHRLSSFLGTIDTRKPVNVTIKDNKATVSSEGLSRKTTVLAQASAMTKAEAEQKASQKALDKLNVRPTKQLAMVCV